MKKTFLKTDKKGREEEWDWEETPEVTEALTKLYQTVEQNKKNYHEH